MSEHVEFLNKLADHCRMDPDSRDRCRAAAAELERLQQPERDQKRKRGDYWLTKEGRDEIRNGFDDREDGNCVLPLLYELERLEAEVTARLNDWADELINGDECEPWVVGGEMKRYAAAIANANREPEEATEAGLLREIAKQNANRDGE